LTYIDSGGILALPPYWWERGNPES
jgi:hypothetical protein